MEGYKLRRENYLELTGMIIGLIFILPVVFVINTIKFLRE